MIEKNLKKMGKKTISLFEIFILVVGILAFAYFVGDEFTLVTAKRDGGTATEIGTCNEKTSFCTSECAKEYVDTSGTCSTKGLTCCKREASENIISSLLLPAAPVILELFKQDEDDVVKESAAAATTETGPPTTTTPTEATPLFGPGMWWLDGLLVLAANAAIATGLYFGTISLFRDTFGLNAQWSEQMAFALTLGYGIGAGVSSIVIVVNNILVSAGVSGFTGVTFASGMLLSGLIGLGVAVLTGLICLFACKEARIDQVTFTCYPWQPETGGEDCNKCNEGQFDCTSYKCQSLGQSCELLNAGTDNEVCEWVNRNDIAPPTISSWNGPLLDNYEYNPDVATLPPDRGVRINYQGSDDGCIPPFARLTYGISLDKPGRCKITVNNRSINYKTMAIPLSNGLYKYNHTLLAFHGGVSESTGEGFNIPNGGNYEVFIRCESRNGYSNEGTFVFKYCVDDEPDRTAPEIMLTDPLNGWPIQFGQISEDVIVYTDKPADCKWSHNDEDYDLMANTMVCDQSITQVNANLLYQCRTNLTGLLDGVDNNFYFRCKSYPLNPEEERYKNEESYIYTLIGTRALVIDWAKPDGITIKDATDSVKVTLEAHTSAGYKDGESICYFKESSRPDTSYVQFANTNDFEHSQELWFTEGGYDYSIRCCDLGGNCAVEDISFIVDSDRDAPIIARVYNDNKKLKIITNEEAECVYDLTDCTYNFEDGVAMTTTNKREHLTEWNTNSDFYIKCKDKFANEPFPNECSIVARPFSGY